MTIGELKARIAAFPDDWDVVVDNSTDYEDYTEASMIQCGTLEHGICGGSWKPAHSWNDEINAIIIR